MSPPGGVLGSSKVRRWAVAVGALLAAAALLVPAAADWLVTRDGARIETAGPWRVENRLVVFERPDGTYASMRLSEIDLEASERLTRELAERARAPEPVPEERPAVVRLTEKDLPPVPRAEMEEPANAAGSAEPEDGSTDGGDAEAEEQALQIVTWRDVGGIESSGIELAGDVRNVSEHTALAVEVTVILLDEAGDVIETGPAVLTSTALPPGQTAGFRASFPGVFHYAGLEFRTAATFALSGRDPEEAQGEEGTESAPGPGNSSSRGR